MAQSEKTLLNVSYAEKFDVVYPSISVEAPAPVAANEKVVDKRGTREVAEAYLAFLF